MRTCCVALLAVFPSLAATSSAATSGNGLPISDAVLQRQWTGAWIACPGAPERDPGVFRFRKSIDLATVPPRFVVHVSADQRFVLHVNGRRVGIGPSRGDILFWRFETFDLAPFLKPGPNLVSAIVWNFGTQAPAAQITDRTGFVVQGDGDAERAANTDPSWECAPEPGHQPWPEGLKPLREEEPQYLVVGPGERLDAAQYDWSGAAPSAPGAPAGRWKPAVVSALATPRTISVGPGYQLTPDGRLLVPDELPPMEYRTVPAGRVVKVEGATLEGFPESGPARVPPNARASLLVDRKTLVTAYPELTFSGGRGSRIRVRYQEALLEPAKPWKKGHRDDFESKRFVGYEDEVVPDGGAGRVFHPLWWRTWRYMRIEVETAAEPLTLDRLAVHFTGYPFEERGRFDAGDATLGRLWEVGWRTARSCAHETYVDCPYYEQLQYVGDTRIQALISYAVAGDDRLARQAIESFERSRRSEGITYSRYPSAPQQFIPPFSLLWVGMVHDYWTWRDDAAFVRRQLGGTRTVLDWFTQRLRPDGLLGRVPWWNFVDWCDEFEAGVPPQDADGGSVAGLAPARARALREAADLEAALGEPERAARHRQRADAIADRRPRPGLGRRAGARGRHAGPKAIQPAVEHPRPPGGGGAPRAGEARPRSPSRDAAALHQGRGIADLGLRRGRARQRLLPLLPGPRAGEAGRRRALPARARAVARDARRGPQHVRGDPRRGHAVRLPRVERAPELRPAAHGGGPQAGRVGLRDGPGRAPPRDTRPPRGLDAPRARADLRLVPARRPGPGG